jgi:hypothetical protein
MTRGVVAIFERVAGSPGTSLVRLPDPVRGRTPCSSGGQGHPQLNLNVFKRAVDSLYVLGFIEFADAAYHRFDEMTQLVAIDLSATGAAKQRFAELKASHYPDLRGGTEYLDSPRHAN